MKQVIVEVKVPSGSEIQSVLETLVSKAPSFQMDPNYVPVPVTPADQDVKSDGRIFVIRGSIMEESETALQSAPGVLKVWTDARIEPFVP